MITGSSQYLFEELGRRVEKDRADRAGQMAQGFCQDYADYRYAVGFIDGMAHALTLSEEIRKEQERA